MNCPLDTREELLVAYSSRQLDASQNASLELHLRDCSACREFVTAQRAVWEALDLWEPAAVSPDLNRLVHQSMDQHVSWWDRLARPLRPLFLHRGIPLVVAASLVFAAGLLLDPAAAPPPNPGGAMAEVDPLQPEQVVNALDQLDAISQFDHLLKPDTPGADPDSKM